MDTGHARGVTGPHGASQGPGRLRLGKEEACCPAQPSCVLGSEPAPRGRRGAWLPAPRSVAVRPQLALPHAPAASRRPPRPPGGALKLLSHRSLLTTSAEPSTWTRPGASRTASRAGPCPRSCGQSVRGRWRHGVPGSHATAHGGTSSNDGAQCARDASVPSWSAPLSHRDSAPASRTPPPGRPRWQPRACGPDLARPTRPGLL